MGTESLSLIGSRSLLTKGFYLSPTIQNQGKQMSVVLWLLGLSSVSCNFTLYMGKKLLVFEALI